MHISTGFFGFGEGSGTCQRRFAYQKKRNRLGQALFPAAASGLMG
jgi:hypothetical protein